MQVSKFVLFGLLVLLIFAIRPLAQDLPAGDTAGAGGEDTKESKITSLANISSTAPGGLWSSPSTWTGGVVPGAADNVTISPGSAVVIDTAVTVANLTVGPDISFNVGVLTFDPTAARTLTVNGDLTVSGLGLLTTPSAGAVTTHTITVGGNLTNNGILDLSTNSNQAGAGLVFTNASSNTFDGGGPQTNIRTITVDKGTSSVNTLTLSVLNFTVQGSSTDTAASGYLTLTNGTFKISGTFSGNHRTFPTATYTIPATASFWLDNPNYTVTPQNGNATVPGMLRVSAGTYNVGTAASDSLLANPAGQVVISGGSINIAGSMRSSFPGNNYNQSGGTVTTCIAGNFAPCFNMSGPGTGGDLVIQTPNFPPSSGTPDYLASLPTGNAPGTTLRFGNALTPVDAIFTAAGGLPNMVVDTTTGPHTVRILGTFSAIMRNINIQSQGTLDLGTTNLNMYGDTFVNNGTLAVFSSATLGFYDLQSPTPVLRDISYSGTGVISSDVERVFIRANSFTFGAAVNPIRTRIIQIESASVINSGKLILGNNDNVASTIALVGTASLDSPPIFDLGTGGQNLFYSQPGNRTIGPEINPARTLIELNFEQAPNVITLTGGDLTITERLIIDACVIDTGGSRIIQTGGAAFSTTGYIKGTLVRKYTSTGGYTFFVGDNHSGAAFIQATTLGTNPTFVSVKATDAVMPGLPPATSASFSWTIEQTGTMTSTLRLSYNDADINGTETLYKIWRTSAQLPLLFSNSSANTGSNTVTVQSIADLTGNWGIAESAPRFSISGGVFSANGSGIRNAIVSVTGGSLTAPRIAQTGPFGTYVISNLDPGGEYTVRVSAKRHRFSTSTQVISSMTDVANVNFTANPEE